jgi:hypothetical protein
MPWEGRPLTRSTFGGGPAFVAPVVAQGLPAGVTLQAIDGETMTSPTTMSNNYHSRNGFTFASSNSSYPGQTWDDPKFFRISDYYGLTQGANDPTAEIATMVDLGLNCSNSITTNTNPYTDLPPTIWGIAGGIGPGYTGGQPENPAGNYIIAIHIDEIDAATPIGSVTNAYQDNRFWNFGMSWNGLVGDIGGVPYATIINQNNATPNATTRKCDWAGGDFYWFSAGATNGDSAVKAEGGCVWAVPTNNNVNAQPALTVDQMQRASNYGNMIDVWRSYGNNSNLGTASNALGKGGAASRIPLFAFIESTNGNTASTTPITPAQLNAAAWASIIHGARGIDYFTQTTDFGANNTAIYIQAKATNLLIKQLAPVINSPFAKGFCTATPHGYTFPIYEQDWSTSGIETCAHWYQGGNVTNAGLALVNGFYVFASVRGSQTQTNVSATFTVASGSLATVVGESRTIPISGGQFTDTFATGNTIHIYQIS